MNNQDYWAKRSAQQMWGYMDEAEIVASELTDLYIEATNEVQRAARKIFQTYRSKYGLSYEEAERLLKMISDPTDLRAVLRKLEEDPKNAELIKQIEGQAYGSRLARLSSVYSQIDNVLTLLYAEQQKRTKVLLEELARQAYYDTLFNLHQYSGYGFDFKTLSKKQVEEVLNSRWYGKNYSEKIWANREKLAKQVKKELIKNLLTGRPLRDAAKSIEERFAVGYGDARRLIRTESCYTCNQLQLLSMKEHGVKRYIFIAILDLKTSEICRGLDKKDFAIEDAVAGKNCPPMHPWCRSTIIAYVPKELLAKMKQSAIDPVTGERIKVPGDMTHAEWYEKFVKAGVSFSGNTQNASPAVTPHEQTRLETIAQEVHETAERYVAVKSKWSGKIDAIPAESHRSGGKEWNCDISLMDGATKHIALHEELHARSVSHYDPETYRTNRAIEELSVELLAREICRKEGWDITVSRAYRQIKYLKYINHKAKIAESNLDFARMLLEVPLPQRAAWLDSKIFDASAGIMEYNSIKRALERALKWNE